MNMAHDFSIDRQLKFNDHGDVVKMSAYWQVRCSCGWEGRRIEEPGPAESKQRMEQWENHRETESSPH